jgi:hypothetical protein
MCFIPIVKQFFMYWSWLRIVPFTWTGIWAHGGCESVRPVYWGCLLVLGTVYMIPPLVFPGVHIGLVFTVSFTWLTEDFFFQTGRTEFDCGLFLNVDKLILVFEMGQMASVTGRQGMLTPPRHLIQPLVYPEVRICPILKCIVSTRLLKLTTVRNNAISVKDLW